MSAVNQTQAAQAQVPQQELAASDVKESLAQVVSALTGTEVTAETLDNQQVGEDVMMAALTVAKLKTSNPQLAERLLKALPRKVNKNINNRHRQAVLTAVNDVLSRAVKNGKLTKKAKAQLMNSSFNQAQLDEKANRLSRKNISVSKEGNIDASIEKALGTDAGNGKALKAALNRADKKKLSKTRSEQHLEYIQNMLKENRVEKPAEEPIEEIKDPNEDLPMETPKYPVTGMNDFAYFPESETDGKIFIKLPLALTEKVSDIFFLDNDGNFLEEIKHVGKGHDGRSHFRGQVKGADLPDDCYMQMIMTDGSHLDYSFDPDNFYSRTRY